MAHATQQHPARRARTVGEAVTALGLTGLGCLQPALSRGPRFCHPTPTSRLLSARVAPDPLHDAALARAWT